MCVFNAIAATASTTTAARVVIATAAAAFLHCAVCLVDALVCLLLLFLFFFAVVFFLTHCGYHLVFLRALSIVVIASKIVASARTHTLFPFLFHVHFYFLEFMQLLTEYPSTFLTCMCLRIVLFICLRLYFRCDKCRCCCCCYYFIWAVTISYVLQRSPIAFVVDACNNGWTKCEYLFVLSHRPPYFSPSPHQITFN